MTTALRPVEERELQEVYSRYKELALSTGAALLLDAPVELLAARLDALLDECAALRARGSAHDAELTACVAAGEDLHRLLHGDATEQALADARASHRRLRKTVWNVIPCEYVPCCAPGHDHDER